MARHSGDSNQWIRNYHPAPESGARLVCFPHAGGAASFYFPVSLSLAPTVDVLAVQYPGRQDRRADPCIDDIHQLADEIFDALTPWADRPLTFFGHSMGAIVAFEVARRFERAGTVPAMVFVSGRRAPSCYRDEPVHWENEASVITEVELLSGTDPRLLNDDELLRMILPALRSDYKAIKNYHCDSGTTLRAPITALVGDADPRTSLDEARAWRAHTTGPFAMQVLPGGHFYLTAQQAQVIQVISESILSGSAP